MPDIFLQFDANRRTHFQPFPMLGAHACSYRETGLLWATWMVDAHVLHHDIERKTPRGARIWLVDF